MLSLERWQKWFRDRLAVEGFSERTVANYAGELPAFFRFLDERGISTLGTVTQETLEDYRTHLFYAQYRGKRLKLSSQARRLSALKTFFRLLGRAHHIVADPAVSLDLPRSPRQLPRANLSEQQVKRLLETPDTKDSLGLRDRAILEVLYGTAIRTSELTGLRLDDIDLAQDELLVRKGKGNKSRVVPLGEEAQCWVERYLERSRPFLARFSVPGSERIVFLSWRGKRLHRVSLAALVRRVAARAGLEARKVTPHILRHCCATHMLRRGAGLRPLQELLGHESASTTQRYTKIELSDLRRVHRLCHPRESRKRRNDKGRPPRQ